MPVKVIRHSVSWTMAFVSDGVLTLGLRPFMPDIACQATGLHDYTTRFYNASGPTTGSTTASANNVQLSYRALANTPFDAVAEWDTLETL